MRAAAVAIALALAGCSIAAGPFGGSAPRVAGGGGYATASVGPSSPSSPGKHVGAFICANCGYGIGTMPGYGHLKIKRSDTEYGEITDVNLDVYIEWLFRFTPRVNISIATVFQVDSVTEPPSAPGDQKEADFTSIRPTVNWNVLAGPWTRFWVGGGYLIGGVGGTSANGAAGVLGAQTKIGSLGFARLMLRVEGSIARGANEFQQEWVNAGFVLWFDPDWR